ncbi:MAG: 8-amino-7-oxononanoate synthase [Burkholderiales bacterium]|nr:8-amino-7-oxononanoate synthase [Burkholderiales bacterium]
MHATPAEAGSANPLLDELARRLDELDHAGLRRTRRTVEAAEGVRLRIDGRWLLSFCSNDYLGLSGDPRLLQAASRSAQTAGAGASALISGHWSAHERLETELARFVGAQRALLFSTGYMANLGIVPALAGRGDAVFSDALNHASIVDAARLSRADVHVYPHRDVRALARMLEQSTARVKLVASDAVFSMDGTIAPLRELIALCEAQRAWLVLDDAHGLGVLGPQGRGTPAHFGVHSRNLVHMGTLGKAAGVAGAFAAGDACTIEWLLQRARTYVFTTASPPMLSDALHESLRIIAAEDWRRARLRELARQLQAGLAGSRYRLLASDTAIQPIVVGTNEAAVTLAAALIARGIWVPAIRPPTVPAGTARLRVSLSAAHDAGDVQCLVDALRTLEREIDSAQSNTRPE